jgi:hypothetical protein
MTDAGMLMPALGSWMPMPTYAKLVSGEEQGQSSVKESRFY